MTAARRTRRRRGLATALRLLSGGRGGFAGLSGRRIRALAREAGVAPADSDPAELLARSLPADGIPAEMAAAICAAMLPILAEEGPASGARP